MREWRARAQRARQQQPSLRRSWHSTCSSIPTSEAFANRDVPPRVWGAHHGLSDEKFDRSSIGEALRSLEMRSARPITRATYLRCPAKFLDAVGKPIKQVTSSDVEQFLLAQTRDGRAPRTRNIYLASIGWPLRASGRRDVTASLPQARVSKALGTVLSGRDVEKLLAAITSLKHRAILIGKGQDHGADFHSDFQACRTVAACGMAMATLQQCYVPCPPPCGHCRHRQSREGLPTLQRSVQKFAPVAYFCGCLGRSKRSDLL